MYKEDGTKYEIIDKIEVTTNADLYLLPVKSERFPDFNGIYFSYPVLNQNDAVQSTYYEKAFYNANELEKITKNPIISKSTIMTSDDGKAELLKSRGFPNTYNANIYKNDVWTINDINFPVMIDSTNDKQRIQISVDGTKVNLFQISNIDEDLNFASDLQSILISANSRYPYQVHSNFYLSNKNLTTGMVKMNKPGYQNTVQKIFNVIWGGKLPNDENSICIKQDLNNGTIKVYKDIIMMSGSKIVGNDTKGLKTYKNIVMMNNTKIYNENGTEYNIIS